MGSKRLFQKLVQDELVKQELAVARMVCVNESGILVLQHHQLVNVGQLLGQVGAGHQIGQVWCLARCGINQNVTL